MPRISFHSPLLSFLAAFLLLGLNATAQEHKTPPADMALIPGGKFQMGIDSADIPHFQSIFQITVPELFTNSVPRHTVKLRPFYLDKYLVTNAQYFAFTQRPRDEGVDKKLKLFDPPVTQEDLQELFPELVIHKLLKHWVDGKIPAGLENHPVTNVTWNDALAYCMWQDKRLPTEAEWEFAARGGGNPVFPWGDTPADPSRANFSDSGIGTTTVVGKYPPNGYGLYDMAGNVWQYMLDSWALYSEKKPVNDIPTVSVDYLSSGTTFKVGRAMSRRVIRGGSFDGAPINMWVEYRDSHPPDGAQPFVGFRCAKSVK